MSDPIGDKCRIDGHLEMIDALRERAERAEADKWAYLQQRDDNMRELCIQQSRAEKAEARIAELEGALRKIRALDYTRAAVNACGFDAVRIADAAPGGKWGEDAG